MYTGYLFPSAKYMNGYQTDDFQEKKHNLKIEINSDENVQTISFSNLSLFT